MGKEGQNWSFDAIAAVALFFVAILVFLWLSGNLTLTSRTKEVSKEGERVLDSLDSSKNLTRYTLIEGNKISTDKLLELASMDYNQLKTELGIRADFCIHLEDSDGNLINITGKQVGIGSDRVTISNTTCGPVT